MKFRRIGNAVRIHVSLPKTLLLEIDVWCKLTSNLRSEFVREAIRCYIKVLSKSKKEMNGES